MLAPAPMANPIGMAAPTSNYWYSKIPSDSSIISTASTYKRTTGWLNMSTSVWSFWATATTVNSERCYSWPFGMASTPATTYVSFWNSWLYSANDRWVSICHSSISLPSTQPHFHFPIAFAGRACLCEQREIPTSRRKSSDESAHLGSSEIVHTHRNGMVSGATGLSHRLEMVVGLLFLLVPRLSCLVHVADLCAHSEESTRFQAKDWEERQVIAVYPISTLVANELYSRNMHRQNTNRMTMETIP